MPRKKMMREVAKLTRPEGMTRQTWAGVHAVLGEIASFYPKAYPSQLTISARTGIPVRSVKRYIAAAKAAGLLDVTPDAGAGPKRLMGSRTNLYGVNLAPYHGANLARESSTYSYGVAVGSPPGELSFSGPRSAPAAQDPPSKPRPEGSTVAMMSDWRDPTPERQVGTPPAPSLARSKWPRAQPAASEIVSEIDSGRRQRKREPKPPPEWKRLADHFETLWRAMQETTGRHKDTRGLENYRMVRTYLGVHFPDRSELEVQKLMEEFVTAVSKRDITIKPGQSGWLCFTGAWGRQHHVVVGDRYAAYRRNS